MALKPITRQEQIIVGKNLEPITRMERFLKEYGGGSGGGTQSDWNQTDSSAADFIKNKPFVVVNLDFETFSLDKTATEISELTLAGKTVLLGATGTPLSTLFDIDGNLTGVYTNIFSSAPSTSDTFIIVQASTYAFDLDGNFVGIETGTFNVSRDA